MGWWVVQTTSATMQSTGLSQNKNAPLKLHPKNHTFGPCRSARSQWCRWMWWARDPTSPWRRLSIHGVPFGCCGWSRCVLSVNQLIWQMYFFIVHYIDIYICSLLYDRYRMTYEVYYLYSISMCLKHLKTILAGLLTVSISCAIGMIWCLCPSQTLALESTFNFLWICVDAIGSMLRTRVSSIDIWCKNFKISSTY